MRLLPQRPILGVLFSPLLLFCIKIHCFYMKSYTGLFCGFLICFFQLGLSHRSCETLGENICIGQGASLQNCNKQLLQYLLYFQRINFKSIWPDKSVIHIERQMENITVTVSGIKENNPDYLKKLHLQLTFFCMLFRT